MQLTRSLKLIVAAAVVLGVGVGAAPRPDPSLDADGRANVWAKFPAPPEDVQKISVVVPTFPPFEGIPISR